MIVTVLTGVTGIATTVLKKDVAAVPGKLSNRVTTGDSYTWNSTHNTESAAV
jgi:hypothetical protein